MKKEIFIVGTRPDIIKVAPILLKLDKSEYTLVHTGQHRELAIEAFAAFGLIPDISFDLMEKDQTLAEFTARCYEKLTQFFKYSADIVNHVWVHGDTSTALVGAQVAKLFGFRVIHIEAGLRSFDMTNPWPEEMFRVQIDTIADVLLTPTLRAKHDLIYTQFEFYPANQKLIEMTGNTIVDALEIIKPQLPDKSPYDVPFVLATIHRRESFGQKMIEIFKALKELSKTIKVVIPAHMNPNVRKALDEVGLEYIEPLSYKEFLTHLKFCEYVITDSGGVQEEAPSFHKKSIVFRSVTERPEAVEAGLSILIDNFDVVSIISAIKKFTDVNVEFTVTPFGEGQAAERIVRNLHEKKYD